MLIITGPTGVGKTDLALTFAERVPSEIINIDTGQLYKPLAIGTAKPDWQNEPVPHHFFDVIDTPRSLTVIEYRQRVLDIIKDIQSRGKLPVLVGGSGFYINSLFFPPSVDDTQTVDADSIEGETHALWRELADVDPVRAQQIHENDRYRITRALAIWRSHKIKPSEQIPCYDPIGDFHLVVVTRDRDELYGRINQRTHLMLDEGWIDEVVALLGTEWEEFLWQKKIIGYDDVLEYLQSEQADDDYQRLISNVQKKTRNYAKRQLTYFTMLDKKLSEYAPGSVEWANLTLSPLDLYLDQLVKRFESDQR